MNIKKVTVIGANGTLGSLISAIFASFGQAEVYMISRKNNIDIDKIASSVKAMTIKERLVAKNYDDFEECVSKSDLIFESVAEDIEIKNSIHHRINACMKKNAIIATGTSGLSIEELAKNYSESNRKDFIGIHFFNPPYQLTLCELIPNKCNSEEFIRQLYDYLTNTLLRKTVIVRDEPGFLANNIGFNFINTAMQYAEQYKELGGIDYIDYVIGKITGRNMAPMQTADFVGLDVCKAIIDNIYNKQEMDKMYFKSTTYIDDLINQGNKGMKTEKGLYDNVNKQVYDIKNSKYRTIKKYNFNFLDNAYNEIKYGNYEKAYEIILNDKSTESKIMVEMLLKYIVYSIKISEKVANNITDCDIAMAEGFNWIPPFSLIELLGGANAVIKYIHKYLKDDDILKGFNEKSLMNVKSSYDYRKYIRGRK